LCEQLDALVFFCTDINRVLQQQPSNFDLIFDSGQVKGRASPPVQKSFFASSSSSSSGNQAKRTCSLHRRQRHASTAA
jgi:hypothetical protein